MGATCQEEAAAERRLMIFFEAVLRRADLLLSDEQLEEFVAQRRCLLRVGAVAANARHIN